LYGCAKNKEFDDESDEVKLEDISSGGSGEEDDDVTDEEVSLRLRTSDMNLLLRFWWDGNGERIEGWGGDFVGGDGNEKKLEKEVERAIDDVGENDKIYLDFILSSSYSYDNKK